MNRQQRWLWLAIIALILLTLFLIETAIVNLDERLDKVEETRQ